AEYAPVFNLHQLLWDLPGFSFLRAPARFSYLVVFACACLAGFGLQALHERRLRARLALVGGVPAGFALAVLLVLLPVWRNWLAADPQRALGWAQSTYLASRAQYPIDPQLVVDGFLTSLDLTTIKTAWSLVLLGLTALAFLSWLALGSRRAELIQVIFVGLLALDLLVFTFDFHPRLPLLSLTPTLEAPPDQRVLMRDSNDFPDLQPNQLLAEGIPTTDGYSSLPSQRYVELATFTSADPRLFDLWSAPLLLEPPDPADAVVVDGVGFRSQHPLIAGFGGSTPQVLHLPPVPGSGLRLIGTLSYAYNVPQGQTVATLSVGDSVLPIRAGIELSERAYDRPSLKGLVQHQKVPVAFDFEEATPQGEDYIAHLYEANLPITLAPGSSLTFTPTDPAVLVEIHGLAVLDSSGSNVSSLDLASRDGLQRLDERRILNSDTLPRAYVLPRAQAFSPARHPDLTSTQLVASPDVDLHRMVLIEKDPNTASEPAGGQPAAAATHVEDLGPNAVRVTATATTPSYLVLNDFYHRGWTASVDGQPTRVLTANALFRAVPIDSGSHVVDFRFEPMSHLLGALVSVLCLVVTIGAIVWGARRRGVPSRRRA
ncbi:MAG TPA: YfhO family protein, partial [Chloroflexota bacterium]